MRTKVIGLLLSFGLCLCNSSCGDDGMSAQRAAQILSSLEDTHLDYEDGRVVYVICRGEDFRDEHLALLNSFPHLKEIAVVRTSVTHDALSRMKLNWPALEHIVFYDTPVDDEFFRSVTECQNLVVLDITGAPITDATVERFRNCAQLEQLSLERTNVSNEVFHTIACFPKLKMLYLRGTTVTSASMEWLPALNDIHSLWLSDTQIDDAALPYIARLPSLRSLLLANTGVTDEGLRHLVGHDTLDGLMLHGCDVTTEGIAPFLKMEQMQYLGLDNTSIGDEIFPLVLEMGLREPEHSREIRLLNTRVTQEGWIAHVRAEIERELKHGERFPRITIDFPPRPTVDELFPDGRPDWCPQEAFDILRERDEQR